jgi:hypothetical protein
VKNVLDNYRVGSSPLTGEIYLFKASEIDGRLIVKRDAEAEVISAFVGHMMHGAPKGASKSVQVGAEYYRMTCVPMTEEEFEAERAQG